MSADSDGPFGVQSCFTLCGAALVVEQLILEAENAVGNELFEGGVLFHLRSGAVAGMSGIEDDIEVSIDVTAEALEVSDFVKDLCGDDQHMLNAHGSFTLFIGVLRGRFVGCGFGADNDKLMIGYVVLIFKSGGQLGQSDPVFRDDAVHEFLEGVGVAAFGGIEQVECVFDGECGQLSLGIFEYGEWS